LICVARLGKATQHLGFALGSPHPDIIGDRLDKARGHVVGLLIVEIFSSLSAIVFTSLSTEAFADRLMRFSACPRAQ
jgi:hypothetical protein